MKLEEVIGALKQNISLYLEQQNISISNRRFCQCISPSHDDKNASMYVNTDYAHCFSCGLTVDIFAAATILESLPNNGLEWIEDNVLVLAKRFGLDIDANSTGSFNRDSKYSQASRAYKLAGDIVSSNTKWSEPALAYIADNKWDDSIISTFGLGAVDSDTLVNSLIEAGFDSVFLNEIGLIDRRIFSTDNIIFPIKNSNKTTVGFSARRFSKEPKYVNSPTTQYGPYVKSNILYGLDKCSKNIGTMYVFEGLSDVIKAHQMGLKAVALCGTSISSNQIEQLNRANCGTIKLCLDPDAAGKKALVENILPMCFTNQLSPLPEVVVLTQDPDLTLINTGSFPVGFDSIAYLYARYVEQEWSVDKVVQDIATFAANYKSPITRGFIAKTLSTLSGVSEAALFGQFEMLDQQLLNNNSAQQQEIIAKTIAKLQKNPDQAMELFSNALDTLQNNPLMNQTVASSGFLGLIKETKTKEEAFDGKNPGMLINALPGLQSAFNSDWAEKMIVIGGDTNAQPLYSKILTPTGWTTMGEIKVGDTVIDRFGQQTKVLTIWPHGNKDIYKVELSDGTSTECTLDHLWKVQRKKARSTGKLEYKTLSLDEILKDYQYIATNGYAVRKYYVPYTQPVNFDSQKDLLIDAYVLGVLLGDGCLTSRNISFTTADGFIASKLKLKLQNQGFGLSGPYDKKQMQYRVTGPNSLYIADLLSSLELLGTNSFTKFIPKEYLYSSIGNRVELLQGLMDTDGTIGSTGWSEYCTTSFQLAEDVRFLANSLGARTKIASRHTNYKSLGVKKQGALSYRVYIQLPIEIPLFSLPVKENRRRRGRGATWPSRTIKNISYVSNVPVQCITVDSEDHTYITDDFIVTHNSGKSTLSSVMLYSIISNPKNNAMVVIHSTDDSARENLPKYVTLASRDFDKQGLTYREVMYPGLCSNLEHKLAIREKAYKKIYELSLDERLVIKDSKDGNNMSLTKALLKYYRTKYPDRKLIYLIDSFNRLIPDEQSNDERGKAVYISHTLKTLAVKYNCTIIAVCEFNRPEFFDITKRQWPTNKRFAESRSMEFDANATILIYNELHVRTEEYAEFYWTDSDGRKKPRIFTLIGKNKFTDWKGKIAYDFSDTKALFTEVDPDTVKSELEYVMKIKRAEAKEAKSDGEESESYGNKYSYGKKKGTLIEEL